ncbi:MAG: leucyl/phenylalanyl-tRNA--protein transferase, partial [Zetaproteobacteria bacterium]
MDRRVVIPQLIYDDQGRPVFPDPMRAPRDAPLCWGGRLDPPTLLAAYARGIFPWYEEGEPILWWSPDPRMVLFPERLHLARRTRRRIRSRRWAFTENTAFSAVIRCCAEVPRKGQRGTWITPEMIAAYERLHRLGYAHSFEVWEEGRLVGGLYGVSLEGVFFAESMFSIATDGSKAAMLAMANAAKREGWRFIDMQLPTPHLARMGGVV